ncbi:MAG: hypothetical protein KDA91_09740 [Planctomycetaceae bacterium]|nr:hypothetical protein [Planctomycetaceae bacterium]
MVGDSGTIDYVINDNDEAFPDVITSAATINDGDDIIYTGNGDNIAIGGDGNDTITGGANKDVVIGDSGTLVFGTTGNLRTATNPGTTGGDDTIFTGNGENYVIAGIGKDSVTGGDDIDVVLGDSGSIDYVVNNNDESYPDVITSTATSNDGDDTIITGNGDNIVIGGDGKDSITGGDDKDVVIGDSGTLTFGLTGNLRRAENPGTSGDDDTIITGEGNNFVIAGIGNDVITGGSGSGIDVVVGDSGSIDYVAIDNDESYADIVTSTATASDGNDNIVAGNGNNIVIGGDGNDTITSGLGNDFIIGDSGTLVFGTTGNLRTAVNPGTSGGNDSISVTGGNNVVVGGVGTDQITTGAGRDVVLGDSGSIDYVVRDNDEANPDSVESTQTILDGDDVIDTGDGDNIVIAGRGNDAVTSGTGNDFILGDSGAMTFGTTGNLRTATSGDVAGGDDTILVAGGSNTVIGGVGRDTITTGNGYDIILGDVGTIDYVQDDNDESDIDRVTAPGSTLGDDDIISSGDGDGFIFGQTGADTITAGSGRDMIFGDHGELLGSIHPSMLPLTVLADPFTFTSIDTDATYTNSNDLIRAGAGDDIVLGGQGADRILGEDGDDDIIGGHNVADGADAGDVIDAGSGVDVVAGDNATIYREPRTTDVRWRALTGSELLEADGNGTVDAAPMDDPNARPKRTITLLNHTITTAAGVFGNDTIAGGSGDDTLFGQLGDDAIQGDGSVLNFAGDLTIDIVTSHLSMDDIDGTGTDGDDYIEGGGGNDVILGNLGQDDIIGGSSNLFGTPTLDYRPDGQDIIFGGSGTHAARNDAGDETAIGHARDADVILGDNGNIFRVVGINGIDSGDYLTFNYDMYGPLKIVPRTTQYLEYTFGDASNPAFNDEIHGESGDDIIHGMSGNDVLFGDAQDDDIIGGAGNDRIFGGSGEDGILGDEGRIFTSRNGMTEELHGVLTPSSQFSVNLTQVLIGAVMNMNGRLKKSVDMANWYNGGHDVIYGGRGDDFIHGGAGDDAISGAEATDIWFVTAPLADASVLNYDANSRMFPAYNPADPLAKINGFILNFDATDANGQKISDGADNIFGDEGNDWIVGGTDEDRLIGGTGDDLLNVDDNLETNGGLNNAVDAPEYADDDWAFGGMGFDVLLGNTGADRLIDWSKRYNSYVIPIAPSAQFGTVSSPAILRVPTDELIELLRQMQFSSGGDNAINPTADALDAELGFMTIEDGIPFQQETRNTDRDTVTVPFLTTLDTYGGYETLPDAGIRLRPASGTQTAREGAGDAMVSVTLTSPPTSDVVLNIANSNPGQLQTNVTTLTFNALNWAVPQWVALTAVDDDLLDGDQLSTLTFSVDNAVTDANYNALPNQTMSVVVQDNDLVFDNPSDVTMLEDDTAQVTITGIEKGSASGAVQFTATSSNTQLIAAVNVHYNDGDSIASIDLVPVANASGQTTISVVMEDGGTDGDLLTPGDNNRRTRTFLVVVTAVNDAPTIDSLSDVTIREDAPQQTVTLNGISAGGGETQPIRITVTSSNPSLIPSPSVSYTSANTSGSISYKPVALKSGASLLTVRVEDGGLDGDLATTADNGVTIETFTVVVDAIRPQITSPVTSTKIVRPVIQWSPVSDAVSYDIWVQNVTTGQNPMINANVANNSYQHSTDMGIGRYNVWVRAVKADGSRYPWAQGVGFTINTPVTLTPIAKRQQTNRPTISWQPVAGAVRYDLWMDNLTTGQSQFVREASLTTTSWTPDFDMAPSAYRVWVRPVDVSGTPSSWSAAQDIQVAVHPTALSPVTSTFSSTPTFVWTSVNGAQAYEIFIRNVQTGAAVAHVQNLPTPTWTSNVTLPDGNYRWWVAAVGPNGFRGDWSFPSDVFIGGRAQVLTPNGTGSATATSFTWTSVEGAASYEIWVDRVDVQQSKVIYQNGLTDTSFTSSVNLSVGGIYRVWVRAISTSNSPGLWSAAVSFTAVALHTEDALDKGDARESDKSSENAVDQRLPEHLLAALQAHLSRRSVSRVDKPEAESVSAGPSEQMARLQTQAQPIEQPADWSTSNDFWESLTDSSDVGEPTSLIVSDLADQVIDDVMNDLFFTDLND